MGGVGGPSTLDDTLGGVCFAARFLGTGDGTVRHEAGCDCSASGVPELLVDGLPSTSALGDRTCTVDDLKVCDASCAEAWGFRTPVQASCVP
jgi:hypothetical protein